MYQVPHMHELPDTSDETFCAQIRCVTIIKDMQGDENSGVFYAIDILPELKNLITVLATYFFFSVPVINVDSDFNSIISIFQDLLA